jgi:hypothetical protein
LTIFQVLSFYPFFILLLSMKTKRKTAYPTRMNALRPMLCMAYRMSGANAAPRYYYHRNADD